MSWAKLSHDEVPIEMLRSWIDESFRAVAPKKIAALLAGLEQGPAVKQAAAAKTPAKKRPAAAKKTAAKGAAKGAAKAGATARRVRA